MNEITKRGLTTTSQLNHFWGRMNLQFPAQWAKYFGERPTDANGSPTPAALFWQEALTDIPHDKIKRGFDNVNQFKSRDGVVYVPKAHEFVDLCNDIVGNQRINQHQTIERQYQEKKNAGRLLGNERKLASRELGEQHREHLRRWLSGDYPEEPPEGVREELQRHGVNYDQLRQQKLERDKTKPAHLGSTFQRIGDSLPKSLGDIPDHEPAGDEGDRG